MFSSVVVLLPRDIKDALFNVLFGVDLIVFFVYNFSLRLTDNILSLKVIFLHLSPAYRLKKCPPPPAVENAEVIYEDEDFRIGNNHLLTEKPKVYYDDRCNNLSSL